MRHNKKSNKSQLGSNSTKRAFTLIEVMVIVVILAISMQLVVGVLVTIIRQQSATKRLSDVKQEGDLVMIRIKSEIESKARNSRVFDHSTPPASTCNATSIVSSLSFKDSSNIPFSFVTPTGAPAYGQVILKVNLTPTLIPLNSAKTSITNFQMSCAKPGTFSNKLISVSFDIQPATTSIAAEGNASIRYSSLIQLKP